MCGGLQRGRHDKLGRGRFESSKTVSCSFGGLMVGNGGDYVMRIKKMLSIEEMDKGQSI